MESDKRIDSSLSEKNVLRSQMRLSLKEITLSEKKIMSENACRIFLASDLYKSSSIILSYKDLKSEISPEIINQAAVKDKKLLAFPRVCPDSSDMDFYFYSQTHKEETPFKKGSFGIMEPEEKAEDLLSEERLLENSNITVIVPGLAFDKNAGRLGKGKGYYDRYIKRLALMAEASSSKLFLLGMGFTCQITDKVPLDHHDQLLDGLLTDTEMIIF
ncbi:5-formyltetrahydrofolate cyclo-ligase [Treponema sp.]|uniref:5-formyltetrahydrofolate cyclo-ligase n=1 Tax=Treponema sp. TaxID=166 RepID=UPI0025E33F8B|nr:5-formyltetrahydrofolate cyclo-ligase [Treponema sp.]MCR5218811.1 5-formyltetrahydrofolate cyclo-ligase [Treponema sp.]